MIQFLQLVSVEVQPYRSKNGSSVKLGFDRGGKPLFGRIHHADEDTFYQWRGKIGQSFPVRVKTVVVPDQDEYAKAYELAQIVTSLRRNPKNDR